MKTSPTATTARRGLHPLLVTVIVFLLASAAAATLIWRLEEQRLRAERARVASLAGDHAYDLQRRLDQAFSATYALAALVRQGHGSIADFDAVASEILPFYPGVSALGLAPAGVVQAIVPLAGNEGAIGHDMLGDPERATESRRARVSGKLTLAGPFELVQGGTGAVARLPVFLDDEQGNSTFWGFTTVLIRFPQVLDQSLLPQLAGRGFDYELWRRHPDSGEKQVIAASSFAPLRGAVEQPIQVPNGTWTLSLAPIQGWGNPPGLMLKTAIGLLFSLLLAWLAKLLVESKAHEARLEVLVAERTAEHKQAEEELRRERDFSDALLNNLPGAVYMFDEQLKPLRWNKNVEQLLGYSSDEIARMGAMDFFAGDDKRLLAKYIQKVFDHGAATVEAALVAKDGCQRSHYFTGVKTRIAGQICLLGVGIDITDRKRAEETLRYNEFLLREMGRVAKIGGWEFDPATGRGSWTEEVARIHDLDPAAATSFELGLSFYQGESRAKLEEAIKAAVEYGKPYDLELELITANNTHKWVHIIGHPTVENNKVVQVRGSFQDITEHRKLETQYLHAQKMDSIGTLAGGVAHDFNNILTVIVGFGEMTLMKMAAVDPCRGNIMGILKAAQRAAHLTKELLLFSRKQESQRRPVDLNDIVFMMEKFLHRIIGEDIILKQVLHAAPLPVLADSHQLEQVLMNLVVNARDAMPQGGELILRTAETVLPEDFVATQGYGTPGPYALLTVSDSGTGMDKATQQRIFEPFFSTKEVGKGTGLGLAVVYGIVKQHDGFITVYSEPGQGSTFRIYLPLSTAPRQETGRRQEQPIVGGTETILLAEDNDLVRELVTTVLTDAGYTVIVAVDGEAAVRQFRENAGAIQLLLFDLIMPKMNGKEAADAIQKLQPGIKTIFASGYAPDIAQHKASLNEGSALISKPVSPRDLLKKVRDVLDGTPA